MEYVAPTKRALYCCHTGLAEKVHKHQAATSPQSPHIYKEDSYEFAEKIIYQKKRNNRMKQNLNINRAIHLEVLAAVSNTLVKHARNIPITSHLQPQSPNNV